MQTLHVIYIDDEALALENFKATMAHHPLFGQTALFSSAGAALEHAQSHPIDIAFLDIDLPEMNGFDLSAQLKAIQPNIRVAFVTGNIRYMNPHAQQVCAPYVFKPYNKDDILKALLQSI